MILRQIVRPQVKLQNTLHFKLWCIALCPLCLEFFINVLATPTSYKQDRSRSLRIVLLNTLNPFLLWLYSKSLKFPNIICQTTYFIQCSPNSLVSYTTRSRTLWLRRNLVQEDKYLPWQWCSAMTSWSRRSPEEEVEANIFTPAVLYCCLAMLYAVPANCTSFVASSPSTLWSTVINKVLLNAVDTITFVILSTQPRTLRDQHRYRDTM